MSFLQSIKAAWSGGETLGKLLAGAVLGIVIGLLLGHGCGGRTTFYIPGDTVVKAGVVIHDTVHAEKKVYYPVKTGEGSFSFHVEQGGNGFDAVADQPLSLHDIVFHTSKQIDTLEITRYRDTCRQASGIFGLPLKLGASIDGGFSPALTTAFMLGVSGHLQYEHWKLSIEPQVISNLVNLAKPDIKPYFMIKGSYCFDLD